MTQTTIIIQLTTLANPKLWMVTISDFGLTKILEASMSMKISDIISLTRLSPQVPDAVGPEGNSQIEMVRSNLLRSTSCLKMSHNMKTNF